MSVSALGRSGVLGGRPARVSAASRRLAWISVTLGLISLDVEALALLAAVTPLLRWYTDLLLLYGPATVVTVTMLALGGPFAVAGLVCASAAARRGRTPLATLLGVAICAMSLAIPLAYALFILTYLRGLL